MIFQKLKLWLQKSLYKDLIRKSISFACIVCLVVSFCVCPSFADNSSSVVLDAINSVRFYSNPYLDSWLDTHSDLDHICIGVETGQYGYITVCLSNYPFYVEDGHIMACGSVYVFQHSVRYNGQFYDDWSFPSDDYFPLTSSNVSHLSPYNSSTQAFFSNDGIDNSLSVDWGTIEYTLQCSVQSDSEYILCVCAPAFDISDIVNVVLYINNIDDGLLLASGKIVNPIEYDSGITFLIDCLYITPLTNLTVDKVIINVQNDIQYVFDGRLVIRTIYYSADDYTPSQTIINNTWQELLPSDLAVNTSFYGQDGQIVTSSSEYEFLFNHDRIDISGMNCLFVPSNLIMNLAYLSDFYQGFDIVFWNCDNITMQRVYGDNWENSWNYTTNFVLDVSNLVNRLVHGSPSGTGLNFDDVQVYYSETYFLKRGIQSLGVCNDSLVSIDANLCTSFEWLSKVLTNIGTYSHDSASYLYSLSSLSWSDVFSTINSNLVSILTAIETGFANVSSSVSTVIQDTFIYDFFAKSKEVYDGILDPSKDLFLDTYSDTSYAITDGDFEFALPVGNLPSLPEFPLIEIGGD